MSRCVMIGRAITTPHVATGHTDSQMHPSTADLKAIFTPSIRWGDGIAIVQGDSYMCADINQDRPSVAIASDSLGR